MPGKVTISSPQLIAYLEELARRGAYGSQAGAVATYIVRKEIVRLLEEKLLDPIQVVEKEKGKATSGEEEEEE